MRLAIETGRRARVWSSPNPAVGCAIVKSNEVLATGFTHPTGQAHAEVHALSQVPDATGSTVFVTLELERYENSAARCIWDLGERVNLGVCLTGWMGEPCCENFVGFYDGAADRRIG